MIPSLYLRILKHWIMALLITELLIFALFILVVGGSHRQYVMRSGGQNAAVARDFLQSAVAYDLSRGTAPSDAIREAVRRLGESAKARAWVTAADGEMVAASFAGAPPAPTVHPERSGVHEGVQVTVEVEKGVPWYAVAPLDIPAAGKPLLLHLLPQRSGDPFPTGAFAAGLALIGALIALLAVPLSLRITRPLNRLQESALRIAGGDLAARAEVAGRDEIGRLAAAFNSMADTVERMVRGGKELTANLSHELRSPLARIRVASECLKEAVDQGDRTGAREMLEAISEDIDEADAMIGEILQFSKLDLQEPVPLAEEVAPAELITTLTRTVTPSAKAKQIRIDLELIPELKIRGDERWLRTAFKNLLENAVRHTAEGGSVQVVMRNEDGSLVVEVTNTHPPLPDEELELIFTPFYRGKESRGEGTGLGLAIARKIFAMHGGEINARNIEGGFQVRVKLPSQAR